MIYSYNTSDFVVLQPIQYVYPIKSIGQKIVSVNGIIIFAKIHLMDSVYIITHHATFLPTNYVDIQRKSKSNTSKIAWRPSCKNQFLFRAWHIDDVHGGTVMTKIQPYMFEPEVNTDEDNDNSASEHEIENEESNLRLNNTNWYVKMLKY